ncbi:hypothetical protein [Streptobacillus felis]|uniref:hypothetical protein n=1 Tax=Streptobacillus felis TaxID=1384509 RepID=UPI001E513A18|nr:hypothetical protein [Streptobacillus felis]
MISPNSARIVAPVTGPIPGIVRIGVFNSLIIFSILDSSNPIWLSITLICSIKHLI